MVWKLYAVLISATAAALDNGSTPVNFSSASVADTQDILTQWGLHTYFGDEFYALGYDGRALGLMEMSDFDKSEFPSATTLHWKMLLHEISLVKASARRLLGDVVAKEPDTSTFVGVRIKRSDAVVTFGESEDVKLVRTSAGELSIFAKQIKFHGSVMVNGNSLETSGPDHEKRIAKLEADIALLAYKSDNSEYFQWVQATQALAKGLIYHIPFTEGTGTAARVLGSKGGTTDSAILTNGATWDNGPHGSAIKLDGHNDFIDAPPIKGNPGLVDMTGCIWAKFESTSSGGARQYMIDTTPQTFILLVDQVSSGSSVKVDVWFGPGGSETYTGTIPILLNSWNHYCGARRSGQTEVYVDGKLVKTGNGGSQVLTPTKWFVGKYSGAGTGQYYVHGSMCAMRVYDRALSGKEVTNLYNLGECDGWKPNVKAGLIYHIPFDEGKGTAARVLFEGGQSSATLKNGATWDFDADYGTALKLDGQNDFVVGPPIKGKPDLDDMTGCIWAKFASTSSGGKRQYMIDTAPQQFYLLVDESSSGASVKVDNWYGSGSELYSKAVTISLGSWNHYCGARRNGRSEIFLDGQLIAAGSSSSNKVSPKKIYVGSYVNSADSGATGQYFVHGSLCSVRIYNRALHQSEIEMLYRTGVCDRKSPPVRKGVLKKEFAYCDDPTDNAWAIGHGFKNYAVNFYGQKIGTVPSTPAICEAVCKKIDSCNFFVPFDDLYQGAGLCQFAKTCATMAKYPNNKHRVYEMMTLEWGVPSPELKASVVPEGLIYHIPFDDGKGSTARVTGGTAATAALKSGAVWDNGAHGSAIKLDGLDDFVAAPPMKGNPQLGQMTGCLWARLYSTASGGARQYMLDFQPQHYFILVDQRVSGKSIVVDTFFKGGTETYSDTFSIKLNSWNHYCGIRRGTTSEVWFDGVRIKTGTGGTGKVVPQNIYVGKYSGASSGQYFTHGSICGVRIYNRPLAEAEIKKLFTSGVCT